MSSIEPNDPTSFVQLDLNMDNALAYVKKLNEEQKDVHVTMTHIVAHSAAMGLYKMRRDVGHLPFGTFKAEKSFGVTVLVDKDGGTDLIPITIWDAHKLSIFEVAKALTSKVSTAKKGKDTTHNKATALADLIPSFIAQPLSFCMTYVAVNLGIPLNAFSLNRKQFGHIVITNVGTLGYNAAFAPLCPNVHQMALLCTGKIEKRPIVKNDKIEIASMMTMIATGDHRYGDAAIFLPMLHNVKGYVGDPENYDEKNFKENPHYKEVKSQ